MSKQRLYLKLSSYVISTILLLAMISSISFADDGIDITAPEVKSLEILKTSDIDTSETLPCKINVLEDGCGATHVHLSFKNRDNNQTGFATWTAYSDDDNDENDYLFTDEYTLDFEFDKSLTAGFYDLTYVAIQDCNGNFIDYESDALKEMGIHASIHITKASNTDITPTKINSIVAIEADQVDADGEISFYIDLIENGSGASFFTFDFKNENNHHVSFSWYAETKENYLYSGKNKITIDLNGEMTYGTYRLEGFGVNDAAGNYSWLYKEDFGDIDENASLNVTKTSKTDVTPPQVKSVKIKDNYIKTPGIIEYEVELIEAESGVANMHFTYFDEYENYRVFFWNAPNPEKTKSGKYVIKCPISPFKPEGKYTLEEVVIEDVQGNQNLYLKRNESLPSTFIGDLTLKSSYDMAYFGSATNKKGVLAAINKMNNGETAVLDCRSLTNVPEDYFKAIAGKDKTIVLDNGDVQWVFDGKKVKLSQCKSINIKTSIEVKSGAPLGFPDDKKVVVITFANNGVLPGEAEVRVNHDYIATSYAPNADDIVLSYLDDSIPTIEDEDVNIAGDEAAELEIDHNSTFVLSNHKARLVKPSVKINSTTTSSIKLSWTKVPGAKGYVVYRSTSKDGTYKKVKTYKKTTTYTDKDLKSGKRYYYKIKVLSGDTKIKSVYSTKIAAVTKLKKPSITVKSNGIHSVKISWKTVPRGNEYQVYRATSKNGTYKKIKSFKKTMTYIDKNLKSGKRYYYKIKVVSADSKVKSVYSSSSSAKAILKTPTIKVKKMGSDKVKVTWSKVSNAKNYTIYRATSKNGTYKKVDTTKKTYFTNKKLKKNKIYYYKVKANYKINKYSSASSKAVSIKLK